MVAVSFKSSEVFWGTCFPWTSWVGLIKASLHLSDAHLGAQGLHISWWAEDKTEVGVFEGQTQGVVNTTRFSQHVPMAGENGRREFDFDDQGSHHSPPHSSRDALKKRKKKFCFFLIVVKIYIT